MRRRGGLAISEKDREELILQMANLKFNLEVLVTSLARIEIQIYLASMKVRKAEIERLILETELTDDETSFVKQKERVVGFVLKNGVRLIWPNSYWPKGAL